MSALVLRICLVICSTLFFDETNSYTTRPPFDVQSWIRSQTQHNSSWKAISLENFPGEECYRPCKPKQSRVCHYKFVMEHYQAMGVACGRCAQGVIEDCFNLHCLPVDGIERGVLSINRQIPGPFIHVCKDDFIVVDVVNAMAGTSTTLHWHGLHMRETPHMDGVPFITQCPINFATSFRYGFWASEAGTHFYHSHAGHHKINGHYGGLIVRQQAKDDAHNDMYDYDLKEHIMLISDWQHDDAEMFMPGLPTREPKITPTNVLINGKGVFKQDSSLTPTPIEVFKVRKGSKYRFRFINSASHICPVQIQIQNHNITIIATDSFDVKPLTVDTLISTSGERYDFVIEADKPVGDYCIKVKLLGVCEHQCPTCEQNAILSYIDNAGDHSVSIADYANHKTTAAKCYNTLISQLTTLNHPNASCYTPHTTDRCSGDLTALKIDESLIAAEPDHRFYLAFNNYLIPPEEMFRPNDYQHFMNTGGDALLQAAINNISFAFPPISVLTQTDELSEDLFCDEENQPEKCKNHRFCHCVHRLKIKLNSIVDLVIVDETEKIGPINHPFHLHGYAMHVLGMGQIPNKPMTVELFRTLETQHQIIPMPFDHRPPVLDTISLPSRGYAILRFRADNPGFWLLHCHFEYHMAVGMGLVIQVGEPSDFVKAPKGYPKCGNFLPDIDQTVIEYRNLLSQ